MGVRYFEQQQTFKLFEDFYSLKEVQRLCMCLDMEHRVTTPWHELAKEQPQSTPSPAAISGWQVCSHLAGCLPALLPCIDVCLQSRRRRRRRGQTSPLF